MMFALKKMFLDRATTGEINIVFVDFLYRFTARTQYILLILVFGIFFVFKDQADGTLHYWMALTSSVVLLRIYFSLSYEDLKRKTKAKFRYFLFWFFVVLTTALFAFFLVYYIPMFDDFHRMLAVTMILGMAVGSILSLHYGNLIAITFLVVMLIPSISMILYLKISYAGWIVFGLVSYILAQTILLVESRQAFGKQMRADCDGLFLKQMFSRAPVGVALLTPNGLIRECNESFCKIFGKEQEDMLNTKPHFISRVDLSDCDKEERFQGALLSDDGRQLWIEARFFPIKATLTDKKNLLMIVEDKTKEREVELSSRFLVEHDPLTSLLNRRGYKNFIEKITQHPLFQTHHSILYYIDIDNFKSVNDSLGHQVGDKLLQTVTRRMQECCDSEMILSRIGGDEFVLFVPFVSDLEHIAKKREKEIGRTLVAIFERPFCIDDVILEIKVSIGVIHITPDSKDAEEWLRRADIAMYCAKQKGSAMAYYDEELDKLQHREFAIRHRIDEALERDEVKLCYQPIVRMDDEKRVASEMLLRWHDEVAGTVQPEELIALAAKSGKLSLLTNYLIDKVCAHIAKQKALGEWREEYVSVNIEALQLRDERFLETLKDAIARHGIDAADIVLEITERGLIDNFERTQRFIDELRRIGVRCAIDDFGNGYSSLSYLKRLSCDILKIDKLFLESIDQEGDRGKDLLESIIKIGRLLNYAIVVEGVERKEQLEILRQMDDGLLCQGFLFGKPE